MAMSETARDPRVYVAAERTFLANTLSTGLALMGFGFVVTRFGLFLRELVSTAIHLWMRSPGFIGDGYATAWLHLGRAVCNSLPACENTL